MNLTKSGKAVFFLLSYFILLCIIIFESKELAKVKFTLKGINFNLSVIILIALTLITIFFAVYLFKIKKLPIRVFHITKVESLTAETLNYFISILLGIIFVEATLYDYKIWIILVLLYLVYEVGGLFYLQPLLMLVGYKTFKCKVDNDYEIMIITKQSKIPNKKLTLYETCDNIFLLRGDSNDEN